MQNTKFKVMLRFYFKIAFREYQNAKQAMCHALRWTFSHINETESFECINGKNEMSDIARELKPTISNLHGPKTCYCRFGTY